MRKLIAFTGIALVLLATACNDDNGYQISGTVSNADLNDNYVFLYPYGTNTSAFDSVLVQNGNFTFKGTQEQPALAVLRFADGVVESKQAATGEFAPYTATFVLENGKFKAELSESSSVIGTPENDSFTRLQADLKNLRSDSKQITADMLSENAEVVAAAEKKYDEIETEVNEKVKQYIRNNNDSRTAAKLLYDFRYSLNENERRELITGSGETFQSVPGIDRLMEHLKILENVAIGKKFTDFEMQDPEGKTHKLSEYVGNGKVVLIDFWASWCPPCRRDMPHLVKVYKEYKNNDFEIVGVSLDRTADAWKKGIKDLNITWPQMSDLKYWQSEGAALYGVNSIPHTVLVGKDGIIIDKNLRGDALDTKLAELLK